MTAIIAQHNKPTQDEEIVLTQFNKYTAVCYSQDTVFIWTWAEKMNTKLLIARQRIASLG